MEFHFIKDDLYDIKPKDSHQNKENIDLSCLNCSVKVLSYQFKPFSLTPPQVPLLRSTNISQKP